MAMSARMDGAASLRPGAVALASAGLLFAVFPLVRPFFAMPTAGDAGTIASAAAALASPAWVASHLMAAAALVLLPLGAFALAEALEGSGRRARAATVLTAVGSGLLLVVIGGETFGLPAAAQAYATGESRDLVALMDRVRNPTLYVTLLLGLVSLAAGGITLATAIWRSGVLPRAAGVLYAVGLALWMPVLPQAPRVVDGLVIGIAAGWLAAALWRREGADAVAAPARRPTASSFGEVG
jgi:hypothetical protein